MLTICWAAKGGSGTTVFATALALAATTDTLLIDLDGDVSTILGQPGNDGPGINDWLGSDAPVTRLSAIEQPVRPPLRLITAGQRTVDDRRLAARWHQLAEHLHGDDRHVIVDVGTRPPPRPILAVADRSLLVTRACYVSIRHAIDQGVTPTGIVLVDEPGRALRRSDIEASIGAPVVATVLLDPAIARAADAGLIGSRLPSGLRRQLREAA